MLSRYFHTLKHLRPSQFAYRLARPVREHLLTGWMYSRPETREVSGPLPNPFAFDAAEIPDRASDILRGEFHFVGKSLCLSDEIDWHNPVEDDLLWSFNLHYFGWAVELARAWRASGEDSYANRALDTMRDWIDRNPFPDGPGWHPYPTSRRLMNWGIALAALQDCPGWEDVAPSMIASISQQADFLADWPERELAGNHLLANYHALAWTELQFGDQLEDRVSEKLAPFADTYWEELDRQVQSDGCHEENSTSYHIGALKDAFELLLLSNQVGKPLGSSVEGLVEEMFEFLASIVQPDGRAPLLNDSVRGYPMRAKPLLAAGAAFFGRSDLKCASELGESPQLEYLRWTLGDQGKKAYEQLDTSERPQRTSVQGSGYVVFAHDSGAEGDWALFDAGNIGPDHQPGHAHADSLQILMWVDGAPLFVDPGTYTYDAGEWRDWFRSTDAHNTLTVDGEDSSEVWSAFRVARRAKVTSASMDRENLTVTATHGGYSRLSAPVSHTRTVERTDRRTWRIADQIEGEADSHIYQAHFQLPEGSEVELHSSEDRATIHRRNASSVDIKFSAPTDAQLSTEEGWVAEEWRSKESAPRLCVAFSAESKEQAELTTTIKGSVD